MRNNFTTWKKISEDLNKMEQVPSELVWFRIQQKKLRQRLIRISYSSVAASLILIVGVFLFNRSKPISFSGYFYVPVIEKKESDSFLASINFSNTKLPLDFKVAEGNEVKILVPKQP